MRIRSWAFLAYLFVATIVLGAFLAPTLFMRDAAFYAGMRLWANAVLGGLRALCGVRVRIVGEQNIPTGPRLVACNHQSMWETIALYSILPRAATGFKAELRQNPIYRFWGDRAGIPIDRTGGAKAIRFLTKRARALLAEGRQVVIFPEGTRTPVGERRPFQAGVAALYLASGVPCTPVAHNSGAHWRHPGPLKVPGVITITFLPPISPGLPRRDFMAKLQAAIEAARPDLASAQSSLPSSATHADAPA